MDLFNTLETLNDKKLNHRMIVHGINGERVIVPISVIQFVSSIAIERNDRKFAHDMCKFPIKEIILNRYGKKLTDDQYSALLTLLVHCRHYNGDMVNPFYAVKYESSNEKRYSPEFKSLIDSNTELAEAVYNLGFDTGDISFVQCEKPVTQEIIGYLTISLTSTIPDEMFVPEGTYPDAETIPYQD